ncbi:hypothetical protein KO500_16255 [Cellulophaga baltica]|uniref:DUF5703 domain-containing protein n=1 Tax=Cellulophaga TaxID=104264 RepID=UPI001C079A2F|nr:MULTISPECIES: DUF5703 domain-containing protein [Cellulophaga]MBU2997996.1 hypothetical protein [Cellulophaga baltica]MDO6769397.1 DUF5703 domain-containing protein [Cellulophaga sp. 1_MG-2023]
MKFKLAGVFLGVFLMSFKIYSQSISVDQYNVSWSEKSKIASDAMPLGNGTTGALVSVLENGNIWISVRHIDAWSEAHRLLKLGDVEVEVSPNPFDSTFKQDLILSDGVIYLTGDNGFKSKIWIDKNNSVIHVENISDSKFKLNVKLHDWRDEAELITETNFKGVPDGISESPDVIVKDNEKAITWYHRNETTKAFDWTIKALEIPKPENLDNVLENRTFGAMIVGDKMSNTSDSTMISKAKKYNHLKIYTLNKRIDSADKWLADIKANASKKENLKADWQAHTTWWDAFWKSSYIHLTGFKEAKQTSAGYAYTMYLNAMAGEGEFPIIWNGSMFAPDLNEVLQRNHTGIKYFKNKDHRSWGNLMLHQNVRLPFYSMNAAGQFKYTNPFINTYMRGFNLMKEHSNTVFGHEGTVIRESTTLWGVVAPGVYGVDRKGLEPGQQQSKWHRTHWNAGLEVAWYLSEHYDYLQNETFAKEEFIPFASEIVKFFDLHWPHKDGKLYFPDVHVLESFRDADNPMPFIAGLRSVLGSLLKLPEHLTTQPDRTYWKELLARVPEVPTRDRNGTKILANAEVIKSKKANVEVAELYAVFPYHLYGVGLPDLKMAQDTYKNRTTLVNDVGGENPKWAPGYIRGGWHPEAIMAAMVGLTDSVQKEVVWALYRPVPEQRYPGFFMSTHDGTPDVQHSSVAATALQRMILQNVDDKIILLPAFPKTWGGEFKLYAKKNTIIEGKIEKGKIKELKIIPPDRKKDVFIGQKLEAPKPEVWEGE